MPEDVVLRIGYRYLGRRGKDTGQLGEYAQHVTDEPRHSIDLMADDPYEGVNVEDLPKWWRDCLAEFEAHDLYTYVPAHFTDGKIVHDAIEELESEHDVDVKLLRVGGRPGTAWTVQVDGEDVGSVPWTRIRHGISIVQMDSGEFEELIRSALAPTEKREE